MSMHKRHRYTAFSLRKVNFIRHVLLGTALILASLSAAQQNALFYKIYSKEGSSETSYLFGTMHMMSSDKFFFPDEIEKSLKKCDVLCTEIKDVTNQSINPDLLFDENKPLKDYCSESEWDSIVSWSEEILLMSPSNFEENFKYAKPFVILQFMLQNSLPTDFLTHEIELEKIARKKRIALSGLESIEEQLTIFDNIDYDKQIDMLMHELAELEHAALEFSKMEDFYAGQLLDSLCVLTEESSLKGFQEELIVKRNLRWIPKMKELMQGNKVFFAVGAGHLCGDKGVIELLRKEGYTIEAIDL